MRKVTVERAEFYEENNNFYLDITYILESNKYIERLRMRKVRVPIEKFIDLLSGSQYNENGGGPFIVLDDGNVEMQLEAYTVPDKDGDIYFEDTVLEEKPTELTVEEIEKKLGYKIKIVSKDQSNTNK